MMKEKKELPIKVEGIVMRKKGQSMEYLILHRTAEDGGFWQPVTGTLEYGESISRCLLRELHEETGIPAEAVLDLSPEVHRFNWIKKGFTVVELVYGVLVHPHVEVVISPEHVAYSWLSYEEVMPMLEIAENRKGLQLAKDYFSSPLQIPLKTSR